MAPRNSVPARVGSPHSDSYEHRDAFSCEVNGDGDHVVVRLCGELDMAAVPTLMEQVGPLSALFSEVVVDLGGLEFCDSSGLHALVECTAKRTSTVRSSCSGR